MNDKLIIKLFKSKIEADWTIAATFLLKDKTYEEVEDFFKRNGSQLLPNLNIQWSYKIDICFDYKHNITMYTNGKVMVTLMSQLYFHKPDEVQRFLHHAININ